jgi:hypothetical protein
MKFRDLFLPKLAHSDPEGRKKAVRKEENVELLQKVIRNDEDPGVREIAQKQIGIDLVGRMGPTGFGLGIDRLKAHQAHESQQFNIQTNTSYPYPGHRMYNEGCNTARQKPQHIVSINKHSLACFLV